MYTCMYTRTYVCDIFKINITLRTAVCARFDVDGDCGVIGWYAARSVRCTLSSLSLSLSLVCRQLYGSCGDLHQLPFKPQDDHEGLIMMKNSLR